MPEMKNDYPLVTVITVTYNSAKYVRAAIESVLALDYNNIEYIIADDCSTDKTWSIISGYKDERIIAFRNENNLREYNNRNKAIDLAKGEYLIFIDGDDIIFPHAIGSFVGYMERFPEACMAIQKGYYNNLVFPFILQPREQFINYFFGKENLLSSSFASNFFRTKILQKFRLSGAYKSGDDEIRLRLAANYPVLYVPGWMSWPRETPGQASSRIPAETALLQLNEYLGKILSEQNEITKDAELRAAILEKVRVSLISHVRRSLRKGEFGKTNKFMHEAGVKWSNIILSPKIGTHFKDFMEGKNPDDPYMDTRLLHN
jgi:glycosyltransferase involved in cell wall biosynthesis